VETSSNEQDRSQVVLKAMFNGIRLMIIKLGKYNSAEELLIETRTAGSQGHICYRDGDRRVSVTRGGCLHGGEGDGDANRVKGAYNWSLSREWEQVCIGTLWSNQRSISTQ